MSLLEPIVVVAAVLVCLAGRVHSSGQSAAVEKKLMEELFGDYDPVIRPVIDPATVVEIKISYNIYTLGDVDEKSQTVGMRGFLNMVWSDEFLTWNPAEYGRIESIFVPAEKMWTPDVMFENAVGDQFFKTEFFRPRIFFDGTVVWDVNGEMKFLCEFDVFHFPFDNQQCHIEVITWAGTDDHVKIFGHKFDIETYYQEHTNWLMYNASLQNVSIIEDGESFSEIHFFYSIERRSLSQTVDIVVPVILLSVLNGAVFFLPAESGEKITISLTVLLSFAVLLLTFDSSMPSNATSTPLFDVYITTFLGFSCGTVILTVFTIRMHHRTGPITRTARRFLKSWRAITGCKCGSRDKAIKVEPVQNFEHEEPEEWPQVAAAIDEVAAAIFYLIFISMTLTVLVMLVHFSE